MGTRIRRMQRILADKPFKHQSPKYSGYPQICLATDMVWKDQPLITQISLMGTMIYLYNLSQMALITQKTRLRHLWDLREKKHLRVLCVSA